MTLELQGARQLNQRTWKVNPLDILKSTMLTIHDKRELLLQRKQNKEFCAFFSRDLTDLIITPEKKIFLDLMLSRDGLILEGSIIKPVETVLQIIEHYIKSIHIEHQKDIFQQYTQKHGELFRLENTLSLLLETFTISINSRLVRFEVNPRQVTYGIDLVSLSTLRQVQLKFSLQEKGNFAELLATFKKQSLNDIKFQRLAQENELTQQLKFQLSKSIVLRSELYLL